jgi:biopolymer transport protein ExbD
MDFWPQRKGSRLIINVTSLIDVMFLLLIFFMVTSTFKDQPAIELVLPRAATAQETPVTPAVLYLTAGGDIYLNERQVTLQTLPEALRQARTAGSNDSIVLRADARAEHGDVVHLIDLVKESGFVRVSLSAQRP